MNLLVNAAQTFVYNGESSIDGSVENSTQAAATEKETAGNGQPTATVAASAPLIFLHGSGGDHTVWTHIADQFDRLGYDVYVPDFPAHSSSEGPALESIEDSASWLSSLMNVLELDRAHLIGHSQGFLTALQMARQCPERVLSIVGVATAASIPVNADLLSLARRSTLEAAALMNKWSFFVDKEQGESATTQALKAKSTSSMSQNALLADLTCCASYHLGEEDIARVELPTLLILSKDDKMTPIASGEKTAKLLSAEIEYVERAGHMLPYEAPQQVTASIQAFVQQLETQRDKATQHSSKLTQVDGEIT